MVKVISFSVNDEQCQSMLKNIQIVKENLPDYQVWIYTSSDVTEENRVNFLSYNNVKVIEDINQLPYFAIDDPEVELMCCRSAESRITEKDVVLIRTFEVSEKLAHIIRDHYWHQSLIMSGMWGLKKGLIGETLKKMYDELSEPNHQKFLSDVIYPLIKDTVLIHSDIVGFMGEKVEPMPIAMKNSKDFIGNVMGEDEMDYYAYPLVKHLVWLFGQRQFAIICRIMKDFCSLPRFFEVIDFRTRRSILDIYFCAAFDIIDYQQCREACSLFKYTYVDEKAIQHAVAIANFERAEIKKKIIGTCDPEREPKEGEFIIVYGNYPHDFRNLPTTESPNKIYLHPLYYTMFRHDDFECHPCWEPINQIYVLNLEIRKDRYMEILVELTKLRAPLTKIYHYKAQRETVNGDKNVDRYLGATKNHLDVVKHFTENEYEYCLILEDDFTFTSSVRQIQEDLSEFFCRKYDFDVCLVSSSKFHEIRPYDDLLLQSHQVCTTTSGYILQKATAERVLECFETGYEMIKETGDYHTYVCDRYWTKLQKDNKFFLFKRKFGYQRPNYSSITEQIDCHFD
jgi:hypothetical protein